MATNQFKALIIAAVALFIVYFAIMRTYSIPFEEEWILDIIFLGFVVINIVVWKILDAGKAKKKDEQE